MTDEHRAILEQLTRPENDGLELPSWCREAIRAVLAEVDRLRKLEAHIQEIFGPMSITTKPPEDAFEEFMDRAVFFAREAGFVWERVAEEREACARLAEAHHCRQPPEHVCEEEIAAAIRNRLAPDRG